MTELEKFNSVWKFEGQRGKTTQIQYENILFSIWKHHQDWEDEVGFPLKCFDNNTIYRVVKLALNAGLLIRTKNYSVGNHTRLYHKNLVLFDMIFRDEENKYGKWLDSIKINPKTDIIQCLLEDELNKIGKDINIPYVPTSFLKFIKGVSLYELLFRPSYRGGPFWNWMACPCWWVIAS
ncbi:hypothetical protein AGMMS49942_05300 [Spirochaetia bacterium]|nr:hypothetical protein AGMMS49942_05300 [Spirochaetia bacterium]